MGLLCNCSPFLCSLSTSLPQIRIGRIEHSGRHGPQIGASGPPIVAASLRVVSRGRNCYQRWPKAPEQNASNRSIRRRWAALQELAQWKAPRSGLVAGHKASAAAGNADDLPEGATEEDAGYMRVAVQLARKAIGHTSPNPMVGCVIVKSGRIVGRGFHPKAGEPHAEVFALREAGEKAKGATAYVSLEPCNHTGRTPPCSQALVRAEVQRVVVGTVDPNPLVGGMGLQTLRNAGIEIVVGVEEALCQATAEAFFHRITTRKPFVTLRYVMSLDGALLEGREDTLKEGDHYSLLLQEQDAVILTDTSVNENITLLSVEPGAKQPVRVVLAKSLDMPLESPLFDTKHAPTVVVTDVSAVSKEVEANKKQEERPVESALRSRGVEVVTLNELNLHSVLDLLYQRGFSSVLLDSRGLEFFALASVEQAVQKVVVVIVPVIVGSNRGGNHVDPGLLSHVELLKLQRVSTTGEGSNVIIEGYFSKGA